MDEEHIEKFYVMLGEHFSKKERELRHEAGDPDNEEILSVYPGQVNYIRHFLLWCKEHEILPLMGKNHEDEDKEYLNLDNDTKALYAEIEEDTQEYRRECERVCDQIGLNSLANEVHNYHGQKSAGRVTIDNPCAGGHVMGKLSVPIELIKKCLVFGGIPQ